MPPRLLGRRFGEVPDGVAAQARAAGAAFDARGLADILGDGAAH